MAVFNEEIQVKADPDNFYLDLIFRQDEYKDIYAKMMDTVHYPISFLNKNACGNGGTTGMIRYALENDKGLLVLAPNVSIVKSKEEKNEDDNVSFIYGGCPEVNLDAQIVVATYDQFPRLIRELKYSGVKTGTDLFDLKWWSGRTIVVDEYHKLIDDAGYRDICWRMTEMVTKVKSPVILMSATPDDDYAKMLRQLLPDWIIRKYDVIYDNEHHDFDTRLDIWEATKKQLKDVIYTMLNSDNNQHICLFYNSVGDIKKILGQIEDKRIEVLCSAQSKDKVGKYYSDSFDARKKLHFMTSAYFQGHDIDADNCKCIIIASNEFDYLCVSARDIKQIIGRFRISDGGIRHNDNHIWYVKRTPDQKNFLMNQNTYDKTKKDLDVIGDKWMDLSNGIEMMHTLIRTRNILANFDMYATCDNLARAMADYGYKVVKRGEITGYETVGKKRHITFRKAKEMLSKGLSVDFDEYPDINELEEFKKVKGLSALTSHRNTKDIIHNWYKARLLARDQDLEKGDLADIFGIRLFGRYNAKFLMGCMDYLGEETNYDKLPEMMKNYMKMVVIPWKLDSKGNKQDNTWLAITATLKSVDFFDSLYSILKKEKIHKFQGDGCSKDIRSLRLSYETCNQTRSYARTSTLDSILKSGGIPSLKGIPLYDWVNEDKPGRLPGVKKGNDWTSIKRFRQGKISELYADTLTTYRYVRSEMDLADALICDIDGGMTFSEFKEKYSRWTWIAYPTINNVTDDWTKFRVIVPLAETIRLEGEHNLKVLKALRTLFCPYEDPDHQVYSYINYEDFRQMVGNDGMVLDINQEFVDCLNMCITTSYDYNDRRFNRNDVVVGDAGTRATEMTLDSAKSLFLKKLADPTEGARHRVLYPIKKGLSPADRIKFEEWLGEVYPSYLSHWRSHKVK